MAEQTQKNQNFGLIKSRFDSVDVRRKFDEVMGRSASSFISSVLTVIGNNGYLRNADPNSVLMSAMVAATLDLPINPTLGFAAIIPYNDRKNGQVAQFQIMAKGLIQLAERSGQYQRINNAIVYEGQLVKEDPFTGDYEFDYYAKKSDKVIGYVAYIRLNNGFEKYLYMTKEDMLAHATKYSKSRQMGYGIWFDDFDKMALKTILKLLLGKYGILSIEMQRAIQFDQAIVKGDVEHIDDAEIIFIDNTSQDSLASKLYDKEMAEEQPIVVVDSTMDKKSKSSKKEVKEESNNGGLDF